MAASIRVVDLTDVKEGGTFRPRRKPEGDYKAKIVKADDHVKEGKLPGWVLTVMVDGDGRSTYPVYLNPEKKQAWKIAQACRAAGLNVKNTRVKFDPNRLVGKPVGISLEDDEYEGRLKSTIGELFPVSEVGANADEDIDVVDDEEIIDEDEDEEPPAPKARTTRSTPIQTEPEEEDEEPEPVKPVRRRRPAPAPVVEEEEDEEEEEPPAPVRRPRKRAATPPPPPADDEIDDLDLDDLDD